MQIPDLSALTFPQVATFALILAIADVVWKIVTTFATQPRTFSAALVAQFLESHVLLRIAPILLLAALGSGLFGVPAIAPFFQAAIAALAAYAVETVGSIIAAGKQVAPAGDPAPGSDVVGTPAP